MEYIVKILDIEKISKNVKKFKIEKPKNYNFIPGQHAIFKINKPKFEGVKRFFSFSSSDDEDYLEFMARIYSDREGGTKQFDKLKMGDELIISEGKGKIKYIKNGIFIAGGIGISPLISIFRKLKKRNDLKGNRLICMNKTKEDIILEGELRDLFGDNVLFTLTQEKKKGYENKRIEKNFLKNHIKNFNQKFYLCGPFKMVRELKKALTELGAKEEDIISEI